MFETLWRKKAMILFLVVLVVLLPAAVSRPAQMISKAVLTEITIDKQDGQYMLTGKTADSEQPVTASAPSVAECINKIALEQSKQVSFAHCSAIILAEGLKDENVTDLLRYFLYRTELNNNCGIAWLESGKRTDIDGFFKDYLRYSSASVLAKGTTEAAVFKSGVHAFDLDEVQTDAINLVTNQKSNKRVSCGNEVLHILHSNSEIKTFMNDGTPTAEIKIKMKLNIESNPLADKRLMQDIEVNLKEKLNGDIKSALAAVYPQADIFNLYDRFHQFNTRDFAQYLETHSYDDFMQALTFDIKIDIGVNNQ